jgi:hypothetical protein
LAKVTEKMRKSQAAYTTIFALAPAGIGKLQKFFITIQAALKKRQNHFGQNH